YTQGSTDGTVQSLPIALHTNDDSLVEGPEDYQLTISTPSSTTGASVAVSGSTFAVTTTITDNDTATWSLTGNATVAEGATASYLLALAGTLQAGETAKVQLDLTFPPGAPSNDPAETADFVNAFLSDVDNAIAAYNLANLSGTSS